MIPFLFYPNDEIRTQKECKAPFFLFSLSIFPILHAEDSAPNSALLLLFFFFQSSKYRYFCSKTRNFKRLIYICWQKANFFGCFCAMQNCADLGFFFFLFCRFGKMLTWYPVLSSLIENVSPPYSTFSGPRAPQPANLDRTNWGTYIMLLLITLTCINFYYICLIVTNRPK